MSSRDADIHNRKSKDPAGLSSSTSTRGRTKSKQNFRIGTTTTKTDERWNAMLNALREYKDFHGHTLVPQSYTVDYSVVGCGGGATSTTNNNNNYNKLRLGRWVNRLRLQGQDSIKDTKKLNDLNSLGFVWQQRLKWDEWFKYLQDYKEEYGHCCVPKLYEIYGLKLGRWVLNQRTEYSRKLTNKSHHITYEQIKQLDSVGFIWHTEKRYRVNNVIDTVAAATTTKTTIKAAATAAATKPVVKPTTAKYNTAITARTTATVKDKSGSQILQQNDHDHHRLQQMQQKVDDRNKRKRKQQQEQDDSDDSNNNGVTTTAANLNNNSKNIVTNDKNKKPPAVASTVATIAAAIGGSRNCSSSRIATTAARTNHTNSDIENTNKRKRRRPPPTPTTIVEEAKINQNTFVVIESYHQNEHKNKSS